MDRSRYFELRDLLRQRRGESVEFNGRRIPAGIVMLEEELSRECEALDRCDLYLLMRSEYFEAGMRDLEVETARRCVCEISDEPLPWISLAETLLSVQGLEEAKDTANTAVSKAFIANRFVRYALMTQARVAGEAKDAGLLYKAISLLIKDAPTVRETDAALSVEFLRGIPSELLDRTLTEEYVALVRAKTTTTTRERG